MLNIGDNFNYQGRKPNFARDCFNTKQEMKNYPEQGIDTGHISFCLEDLKLYQFQAGNEVNPETGKWRKLIDSILDANSENPVENKVITSKLLEVEKLIGTKATALGKDFELSLDNMGAVIAAALVDLNKNIDELEEAVSEALNSIKAANTSIRDIRINGHSLEGGVNLSKSDVGLGNIDNTSDQDKPLSIAMVRALNGKADKSTTINNKPLDRNIVITKQDLGLGNVDNTSDLEKPISTRTQEALNNKIDKSPTHGLVSKEDIKKLSDLPTNDVLAEKFRTLDNTRSKIDSHVSNTQNPHNVTKNQVGLSNVDNTSDLEKPISTRTQEELDKKVNLTDLVGLTKKVSDLEESVKLINQSMEVLKPELLDRMTYGIRINIGSPNFSCTEIGSYSLRKSLPVHSKIRGCILSNQGEVVKYLPDTNWAAGDVNGSQGQVMVEIPEFWMSYKKNPDYIDIRISPTEIEGFTKFNKFYISAYDATIDRNSNKLSSVCSIDPRYRGGNNSANLDNDSNIAKRHLGKPATYLTLSEFETLATNRGNNWKCLTYDAYKTIFWLFVTETVSLDTVNKRNFDPEQSGNLSTKHADKDTWKTTYNTFPVLNIGTTNNIGNGTGYKDVEITYIGYESRSCIRYRGMENIFGEMSRFVTGVQKIKRGVNAELIGGTGFNLKTLYNYSPYDRPGFIEELIPHTNDPFSILATGVGQDGSSTTYYRAYSDSFGANSNGKYFFLFGHPEPNDFFDSSNAGFLDQLTEAENFKANYAGTRLCYFPE